MVTQQALRRWLSAHHLTEDQRLVLVALFYCGPLSRDDLAACACNISHGSLTQRQVAVAIRQLVQKRYIGPLTEDLVARTERRLAGEPFPRLDIELYVGFLDLTLLGYRLVVAYHKCENGFDKSGWRIDAAHKTILVLGETEKAVGKRVKEVEETIYSIVPGGKATITAIGRCEAIGRWRPSRFEVCRRGYMVEIRYTGDD